MDKDIMIEQMASHYAGGNKSLFSKMIGITPQRLNKWISRNTYDAEILFDKLDNINPSWLLSGAGDMILKKETETPNPLPVKIGSENHDLEHRALARAKAKVVVEIDLDDDEFVQLGLKDKIVKVLRK